MKLRGADILIECLLEQGTEVVFGYPGGAVLNIYDSLYNYRDRIKHILTSHEQHAGHAADGYARATGKTGVVIATSGPGATNLVTAIATANMDSVPLVVITGNVDLKLLGLDSFQEVDTTGVTMPVTKHNFLIRDINTLADTVRKAFFIANDGRKGPVLIDIPKDITAQLTEYEKSEPIPSRKKINPNFEKQLKIAEDLIKASERPYIYTGGGVISSGASNELGLFARIIDAPVSSSLMGQGCYDQTDERYIGMLGMHGTKAASKTLSDCDLFIALGTRFSDRVIGDPKTFAMHAKILHIDIDEVEHSKNVPAHAEVTGDIKDALAYLNRVLPRRNNTEWVKNAHDSYINDAVHQVGTDELPVTPEAVIGKLCELTENKAIITTEVGQNQMWAAMYYNQKEPRTFISSGGLGTMGFGLGAAIGAKTGRPDKAVINIAGDGSFGMNMNELITLSKHNIPLIQLVLNNNVLGMVRQWQRLFYDKHFSETTLDRNIDYIKLGEAFGIKAFVIEKIEDIEPVLKEALEISKTAPVLIECRIDRDINVLPMVPAGKDLSTPILEIKID